MIRRPTRSTLSSSSAASDVYKRQFLRFVGRCAADGDHVLIADRVPDEGQANRRQKATSSQGLDGHDRLLGVADDAHDPIDLNLHEEAERIVDLDVGPVSYTHLRAHETPEHLV